MNDIQDKLIRVKEIISECPNVESVEVRMVYKVYTRLKRGATDKDRHTVYSLEGKAVLELDMGFDFVVLDPVR